MATVHSGNERQAGRWSRAWHPQISHADLRRIAFNAGYHMPLPAELARPFGDALIRFLEDPLGRSLDYHLGLPPRPRYTHLDASSVRAQLYCAYAAQLRGSARKRAEMITSHLAGWLEDDLDAADISAEFESFLQQFQDLPMPLLGDRSIRKLLKK